jgi:hypothetical protein
MTTPVVILVFGEDANDTAAVKELVLALRPEPARVEIRRAPIVLVKGKDKARDQKNVAEIAAVLEQGLLAEGIEQAVAAAWEIEAWWFLWPDAALAVNSKWRRPEPPTPEVGRIENAKEAFRQTLRPRVRNQRPRDYAKSDSPKITAQVRAIGLVDRPASISHSFDRFAEWVRGLTLT